MVTKKKIDTFLKKCHLPNWLFILLLIVIVLRIPSFFEPYSYGDEMIYLTLGQGIRQGVPFYKGLHDNKPPLLYIMAGIAGNLFWFKVILTTWCIATILCFWKLAETLFPQNSKLTKTATYIFSLLITLPLLEGNIANAELFFIGPIIYSFYLLFSQRQTPRNLFISGLFFSIATLFKVPAVFDLFAILVFWLIQNGFKKESLIKFLKNTLYLSVGLLLPIILTIIWYTLRGAFREYVVAAFLQNLGYVSSWRSEVQKIPFFVKNAPLLIRFGIAVLGSIILFWQRKKLSKSFIFICLWLLFTLFAVTLSERPYPHYFLQAVAPLSLLFGILITDKTRLQTLSIIPLSLAFFIPVYFKFWYYPTSTYYIKFFKFVTQKTNKNQYFSSFNKNTPRNYEIAKLIMTLTSKKDPVFVWGDTATIYALSHRLPPIKYVADYHIRDFSSNKEIIKLLLANPPKIIVILPEGDSFPELNTLAQERYVLLSNIDGAKIWKALNPKVLPKL